MQDLKILENKMQNMLSDLKDNYQLIGVRSSFFQEDNDLSVLHILMSMARSLGLDAAVKIGGVECERDITDAISIDANSVIAPMIESSYAYTKLIEIIKVGTPADFSGELKKSIMFETVKGFENIDEILSNKDIREIDSVVIGRSDLVKSMGLTLKEQNTPEVNAQIRDVLKKIKEKDLQTCLGGGIDAGAVSYIKSFVDQNLLDRVEMNRFTFSVKKADEKFIRNIIQKTAEFEAIWLEHKKRSFDADFESFQRRYAFLKSRFEKLKSSA